MRAGARVLQQRIERRPRASRTLPAASVTGASRLCAEVDGGLRVEATPQDLPAALDLLAQNDLFPRNARFARRGTTTFLVVDVPPGAPAHEEVAAVAALLAAQRMTNTTAPAPVTFDVAALRDSVHRAGIAGDALVAHSNALELRLRVQAGVRAARIDATEDAWRIESPLPATITACDATLADQALRCNAAVRFARLTWRGGAMAAQALVPRTLPVAFLLRSARAVAALAHSATLALTTLHDIHEVRAAYARLVLPDESKQGD
jgi:hypothetical protein